MADHNGDRGLVNEVKGVAKETEASCAMPLPT
jgi:hypothetical protein